MKDHRLASKDIFRDLTKHVSGAGLLDRVTLINGLSFDQTTIATVKERFGPGEVGLFIFDADANVRRDIDWYGDRFADGCWVVIDDYISDRQSGADARASRRTEGARASTPAGVLRLGNMDWSADNPDVKYFLTPKIQG